MGSVVDPRILVGVVVDSKVFQSWKTVSNVHPTHAHREPCSPLNIDFKKKTGTSEANDGEADIVWGSLMV